MSTGQLFTEPWAVYHGPTPLKEMTLLYLGDFVFVYVCGQCVWLEVGIRCYPQFLFYLFPETRSLTELGA